MAYKNCSIEAVLELERQRTGNYGEAYESGSRSYDEWDKADSLYDDYCSEE